MCERRAEQIEAVPGQREETLCCREIGWEEFWPIRNLSCFQCPEHSCASSPGYLCYAWGFLGESKNT